MEAADAVGSTGRSGRRQAAAAHGSDQEGLGIHQEAQAAKRRKQTRNIDADDKLKAIFGGKQVTMFEMTKLISAHLS
jgi:chromatin remodeling complex protein RSC6